VGPSEAQKLYVNVVHQRESSAPKMFSSRLKLDGRMTLKPSGDEEAQIKVNSNDVTSEGGNSVVLRGESAETEEKNLDAINKKTACETINKQKSKEKLLERGAFAYEMPPFNVKKAEGQSPIQVGFKMSQSNQQKVISSLDSNDSTTNLTNKYTLKP
jgi:hypothetical protein